MTRKTVGPDGSAGRWPAAARSDPFPQERALAPSTPSTHGVALLPHRVTGDPPFRPVRQKSSFLAVSAICAVFQCRVIQIVNAVLLRCQRSMPRCGCRHRWRRAIQKTSRSTSGILFIPSLSKNSAVKCQGFIGWNPARGSLLRAATPLGTQSAGFGRPSTNASPSRYSRPGSSAIPATRTTTEIHALPAARIAHCAFGFGYHSALTMTQRWPKRPMWK